MDDFEKLINAYEKSLNLKIYSIERTIDLKYDNIEKNTSLAAISIDKRLESMFREVLKDQTNKLITKHIWQLKKDHTSNSCARTVRESTILFTNQKL